jgi:hypothetical protein
MPITVSCQTCGSPLRVPDAAAGKAVRCPKCASSMVVPADELPARPVPDEADELPTRSGRGERRKWGDGDDRPRRRRPVPGSALRTVLRALGVVAWGILLCYTIGSGFVFLTALKQAESAIQEAALGAVFSTGFIGLYIVVRCVEKVIAGLDQLLPNPSGGDRDD